MDEQSAAGAEVSPPLDPRTAQALADLLSLDAATAAEVRERTPPRRRPARQYGPRLDLGGAAPE